MKKTPFWRSAVVSLALTLALTPLASALTVEDARTLLTENYVDPIPQEILDLPTISEITDALGDPYTYYMTAEEYADFQGSIDDTEVVGIGCIVIYSSEGLLIQAVADDSPAQTAGLATGDLIVQVDDTTMADLGSSEQLGALIAGEEGSDVTLQIVRGEETLSFTLTRAHVVFPVVTSEVVDEHIGWIEISSFAANTGDYLETYITEEDEQADRWVIDLRGNPGGYGIGVIDSLSLIVGNQPISYMVSTQKSIATWKASAFNITIDPILTEPLIVLVDGSSASASELFAAAIRDYDVGLIIGTTTFGKGLAQGVFFEEDGSVFKISNYRYYSPNWVTPDRTGVLPHLVVDPNLADEVALLLSGQVTEEPSEDVLVIELASQNWYVHQEEATSETLAPAFAELLSALPVDVAMTLNGEAVTVDDLSAGWSVDYDSRLFTDLETADRSETQAIQTLATLGLVVGDGEGNFDPDGQLTRAQMVAFVQQVTGFWCWNSQPDAPFTDVDSDAWYASYVKILYNMGVIEGNEEGLFLPDELVTWEELLTVVCRAATYMDYSIQLTGEDVAEDENYTVEVADWAKAAAETLDRVKLCPSFESGTDIPSRAETAELMYDVMSYMGVITY